MLLDDKLTLRINYLNKALELFNAAMVVPVYFVTFTSATLITSFILYQGLKASAITLITMVLGFFVICLGITLLQMSKVDPKQLTKLGRKATIFLEATNRPTEESEKGNVSALEEPGMDALRGGFGAVGSIIRARSVSRRLSNASNYGQIGHHNSASNLSTHGLGQLQRFQRERIGCIARVCTHDSQRQPHARGCRRSDIAACQVAH